MKVTKAKGLKTIWPARFASKMRLATLSANWHYRASDMKSQCVCSSCRTRTAA